MLKIKKMVVVLLLFSSTLTQALLNRLVRIYNNTGREIRVVKATSPFKTQTSTVKIKNGKKKTVSLPPSKTVSVRHTLFIIPAPYLTIDKYFFQVFTGTVKAKDIAIEISQDAKGNMRMRSFLGRIKGEWRPMNKGITLQKDLVPFK